MTRVGRVVTGALLVAVLQAVPALAKKPASTPEDRAKAVQLARELEEDPLAGDAVEKRAWLIKWYKRVPDIKISVCSLLGPFPNDDHPFYSQIIMQSMFSGMAFMIEHPDQSKDQVAVQRAGMLGALKAYEAFVKVVPDARLPFLDDLLNRRDAGTLDSYTQDAVPKGCK